MQVIWSAPDPLRIRDQLEIERYRLSEDVRPDEPAKGLVRFWERYKQRRVVEDRQGKN